MPEQYTSMEQAAEALAAANRGAEGAAAQTPPDPAANPPTQAEGTQEPPAPTETDSFTDVRYDDLPDDVRGIVQERERQMQADYTRKTQELAAQRQEAEQALEFVSALQTDPDFALQVRDQISSALQQAGLSPAEAAAEATRQVTDAQATDTSVVDDDPDEAIAKDLAELKSWREEFEREQAAIQFENELDRMDARIRQDNPGFTEDDMRTIYALSYATGGNLLEAADFHKQERQRIVESYLNEKGSAPAGEPAATGSAQTPPEKFEDLLDPRLLAAAQRRLAESLGE